MILTTVPVIPASDGTSMHASSRPKTPSKCSNSSTSVSLAPWTAYQRDAFSSASH